jgi:integrase
LCFSFLSAGRIEENVEIYKREGSKFWLVDFTVDGKRYRKSTRATTKTRAMEVAADLIKEAQAGGAPKPKGPSPRLQAFVDERFLPFINNTQLDPDTKRYYENGWRMLKTTEIADRPIASIRTVDARVLEFPGSGANANCALRTLRRILSCACDLGHLIAIPKIKLRKEKKREAVFTAPMEKAILAAAPPTLHDIFLVSQDSGLRPDEAIRMRWENVLWDKNLIFNPDGKTEKSRRYVPLSDRVRDMLRARAQKTNGEWVFPSKRKLGAHYSYSPIAREFRLVKKRLGLPEDLVWYSARHTFATDMLDRTGNVALVQKILGHESIATTQRYLHPALKGVAEFVNERNAEQAKEAERHSLRHSGDSIQ